MTGVPPVPLLPVAAPDPPDPELGVPPLLLFVELALSPPTPAEAVAPALAPEDDASSPEHASVAGKKETRASEWR